MNQASRHFNDPHFRTAVDFSPYGLLLVDRRGKIILSNKEVERIFGYAHQELLDRPFETLIAARYWSPHEVFGKESLKLPTISLMSAGGNLLGIHRNGSEIPIEVSLNPVNTEDGFFVVVSVIDIQQSKRAEQLFRSAVESSPSGMIIVDASGSIMLVNKETERLFGYTREELLGQSIEILVPERFRSYHPQYRAEFFENPSTRRMGRGRDLFGLRKDGTEIPIEIGLNPIRTDQGLFVLSVIVDITDRKRAEESLRQLNETLEDRVVRRTVQLRALAAALTRTEEEERRKLAQALHDHLQQLLVAARMRVTQAFAKVHDQTVCQLLNQIEDLLLQSINESRSLTAELSPPILYQEGLAAGLEWLGRWMQEKHQLKVDVHVDRRFKNVPNDLRAFLFRSVHELLFNVVKHAKSDKASVEVNSHGKEVRITVKDNGRGYDSSSIKEGTGEQGGFGLFSIRERLTYMGGEMKIYSAPGQGTSVLLSVPLQMERAAVERSLVEATSSDTELHPSLESSEADLRIRVLLADDHKIVREGLSSLLADQPGIEVVGQAEDGLRALELVHSLHPDVVVMDSSMPRMDGVEATRRLVTESQNVKVIGLSMHSEDDMAKAMLEAGAAVYLNKAGPSEKLIEAIRLYGAHAGH